MTFPPLENGARTTPEASYQDRVQDWMQACFGADISGDTLERCHRFLEEALELGQSLDCPASHAHALVAYVYSRETGDPAQEMGGVEVTLAALATAADLDMVACGEAELSRVWTKVDRIREKHAAKPVGSALPQEWAGTNAARRYHAEALLEAGAHTDPRVQRAFAEGIAAEGTERGLEYALRAMAEDRETSP